MAKSNKILVGVICALLFLASANAASAEEIVIRFGFLNPYPDTTLIPGAGNPATTGPGSFVELNNQWSQYFTIGSGPGDPRVILFDDTKSPSNIADNDLVTDTFQYLAILENTSKNYPDDFAGGGTFVFDFTNPITSFRTSLIDIDEGKVTLDFFDKNGTLIDFDGSASPNSVALGSGTIFGTGSYVGHTGDTIGFGHREILHTPIFSTVGLGQEIKTVHINFSGSGGIGAVGFEAVPEPGTVILFGSGLLGVAWRRYRRKDKKEE